MQIKQEAVHLTEKIDKRYALWLLHNVEQKKLLRGLHSSLEIQESM